MVYIIYHDGCPDGLTAAAILEYYLRNNVHNEITMVPGSYNKDLPKIEQSMIYFVDFSCKKEIFENLLEAENTIVLLDHHKSAIKELSDLLDHPQVQNYCSMDNTKSGTGLAWDYCYPDKELPKPFACIQDRDLWNWALPESKDFCSGLNLVKTSLSNYRDFVTDYLESSEEDAQKTMDSFIKAGQVVNLANSEYYRKSIETAKEYINIFGYNKVACVNVPSAFTSNLANRLLIEEPDIPFVICWFKGPKGLHIGLRTRAEEPTDVSVIAQQINSSGGGHKDSSGSFIPREEFATNELAKLLLT